MKRIRKQSSKMPFTKKKKSINKIYEKGTTKIKIDEMCSDVFAFFPYTVSTTLHVNSIFLTVSNLIQL